MIKAYIGRNYFKASGHADYSKEGTDIVCSAVSALTQSTLLALKQVAMVESFKERGLLMFDIAVANEQTDAMMKVLEVGLKQISEDFPQCIQVVGEVGKCGLLKK